MYILFFCFWTTLCIATNNIKHCLSNYCQIVKFFYIWFISISHSQRCMTPYFPLQWRLSKTFSMNRHCFSKCRPNFQITASNLFSKIIGMLRISWLTVLIAHGMIRLSFIKSCTKVWHTWYPTNAQGKSHLELHEVSLLAYQVYQSSWSRIHISPKTEWTEYIM